MLGRRKFLATGANSALLATLPLRIRANEVLPPNNDENLIDWVHRCSNGWDPTLYCRMLGAANTPKEGDASLGVAAQSEQERLWARELLGRTTVAQIDAHPPFHDNMLDWIQSSLTPSVATSINSMTLGQLKSFLLDKPESDIHRIRPGLSSDAIACVTKLMSDDELRIVGAKVFNPLPGTKLGAKGYMGARIQPNSPTDDPEDILWQVLDAFAYGVGDVLIGTNPVSSEPSSVATVEKTLKEIVRAFGISDILPYCVLAHIDVQAEVEKNDPGSTALWFQSIAGSDTANGTFDVTLEKMIRHSENRLGPFALYFETGQGADFTNGHGHGTDMVIHESRKYGLARALTAVVTKARQRAGLGSYAWVHVNDVAGFIGPEVFRTKEQLVRCCLEDIVMGKLHGLMIGLDICTTLHMDVSLDDLGWCIDQIMPANPGYLMALPTRIDPMLGYLTTGYHDHVHVRESFGYRVNDAMWAFFRRLGVIDHDGKPTEHFGDPIWVYQAYLRALGDTRSEAEIRADGQAAIARVRARGVFLSERYGKDYSKLPVDLDEHVHRIYDDAKKCIWGELPANFESHLPNAVPITTRSIDRNDYILHPIGGEELSEESASKLSQLSNQYQDRIDTVIVLSDGLNALASTTDEQSSRLIAALRKELTDGGYHVADETLIVRSGRVRAGYRIGETMFKHRGVSPQTEQTVTTAIPQKPSNAKRLNMVHVIGERPGSGHRTLSIYLTSAESEVWSIPSKVDHNITKVVSGIATTALAPEVAAETALRLLRQIS